MSQLPYAATKVVDASTELTVAQKWLWFAIWQLDRGPDRAFISATLLARRKGVGVTYVEQLRRELKRLGLLESGPRRGRSGMTWWPVLPSPCIPPGQRVSDDQVFVLSDRLDGFLRVAREDGAAEARGSPTTHSGVCHNTSSHGTPEPTSESHQDLPSAAVVSPASVAGGGRVGREAPASLCYVSNTPSSTSRSKNGERIEEEGARARERDEEGVVASSFSSKWREFLEPPVPRSDQK